jgi:hypothetical protein
MKSMISKSSSQWKKVDRMLYFLPSVIVDIIFSYTRERMFYLFDECDNYVTDFDHIVNATNKYELVEGLNIAPDNYYEWYMDYIPNPKSGFLVYTEEQLLCKCKRYRVNFICEIIFFPSDAIIHPFNGEDGDHYAYNGFVINKMVCGPKYKKNVKAYKILDLKR